MSTEPLIVRSIRRRGGSGIVEYRPNIGAKTGTSGRSFLTELDEHVEAERRAAAVRAVRELASMEDLPALAEARRVLNAYADYLAGDPVAEHHRAVFDRAHGTSTQVIQARTRIVRYLESHGLYQCGVDAIHQVATNRLNASDLRAILGGIPGAKDALQRVAEYVEAAAVGGAHNIIDIRMGQALTLVDVKALIDSTRDS